MSAPASTVTPPPLAGFGLVLDTRTRQLRPGLWFGGAPARVVRLSAVAERALEPLRDGAVVGDAVAGLVARRLVDAGLAHPVPPSGVAPPGITVVVPVKDRANALDRCLASLAGARVVVVDDGSAAPLPVRAVAARHGAQLIRLPTNQGPAAARNAGLAAVTTALVAFVDSDTEPGTRWLDDLAPHFADPTVAAVAPRIAPRAGAGAAGRYTSARCSLDLGRSPGRVAPYTTVSYVPTAAILTRRSALLSVARGRDVFDPAMRVGEDVDLVWRLVAAGHTVRYEPATCVPHTEPGSFRGLFARRFRYGTSAADLANRHPEHVAPLVLHPWYSSAVAALLARRPATAAALTVGGMLTLRANLRRAGIPTDRLARTTVDALGQTFLGTARYAVQFGWPLLLAGATRRRTCPAALALLLAPPVVARRRAGNHRGTRPDAVTFTVAALADDIAYGAGVVAGCVRRRTLLPLRPVRAR